MEEVSEAQSGASNNNPNIDGILLADATPARKKNRSQGDDELRALGISSTGSDPFAKPLEGLPQGRDPNANGTGGVKQWRARPYLEPVAPLVPQYQEDPTTGDNPTPPKKKPVRQPGRTVENPDYSDPTDATPSNKKKNDKNPFAEILGENPDAPPADDGRAHPGADPQIIVPDDLDAGDDPSKNRRGGRQQPAQAEADDLDGSVDPEIDPALLAAGRPIIDTTSNEEAIILGLKHYNRPAMDPIDHLAYLAWGAGGGLAGGSVLPKIYDKVTGVTKSEPKLDTPVEGTEKPSVARRAVRHFHEEFSATTSARSTKMADFQEMTMAAKKLADELDASNTELETVKNEKVAAVTARQEFTSGFTSKTKIGKWLAAHGKDPAKIKEASASKGQVGLNTQLGELFTYEQAQVLLKPLELEAKETMLPAKIEALGKMSEKANGELDKLRKEIGETRGPNIIARRGFNSYWKDATKGVGGAATLLAINNLTDLAYEKNHLNRTWFLDGIGVPAGLALSGSKVPVGQWFSPNYKEIVAGTAQAGTNRNFYYGMMLAGGSIGASYLFDATAGLDANSSYSRMMRPNFVDALGAGAAFAWPTKSYKGNLYLLAGSWAAGRVWNLISDSNMSKAESMYRNASTAFDTYTKHPSKGALDDAIAKGKKLGVQDEIILEEDLSNWRSSHKLEGSNQAVDRIPYILGVNANPGVVLRGTAVRQAAIAEARLAGGSRLVTSTDVREGNSEVNHDHLDRLLAGEDYDLGGEALNYLVHAKDASRTAAEYMKANKGKEIHGYKFTDEDIAQQNEFTKYAQERINTICNGPDGHGHNMDTVFAQIRNMARTKLAQSGNPIGNYIDDIERLANDREDATRALQAQLEENPDNKDLASQLAESKAREGKADRDAAISLLAIAGYQAEHGAGEEAAKLYGAAVIFYNRGLQVDRTAPDNLKIQTIAQKVLTPKIKDALKAQYGSKLGNPFGIPMN